MVRFNLVVSLGQTRSLNFVCIVKQQRQQLPWSQATLQRHRTPSSVTVLIERPRVAEMAHLRLEKALLGQKVIQSHSLVFQNARNALGEKYCTVCLVITLNFTGSFFFEIYTSLHTLLGHATAWGLQSYYLILNLNPSPYIIRMYTG